MTSFRLYAYIACCKQQGISIQLFFFLFTRMFNTRIMIKDLQTKNMCVTFTSYTTMPIWRTIEQRIHVPGTWLLSCGLLFIKESWNGFTLALAAVGMYTLAIGVKGIAAGFRFELRESSLAKLDVSSSIGPLLLLLRESKSVRSNRLLVTLFCLL